MRRGRLEFLIKVTDAPADADREAVWNGLMAFNERFIGPRDLKTLCVFAYADKEVVGGLVGDTSRGIFFVSLLWLKPETRGFGLGRAVMEAGEREAVARGCRMATLDTMDFQARPFYEKLGYRVFGELEGYPDGRICFFMSKPLAP